MLESIKNSGPQDAATPRRRLSHVEALRRGLSVDPPARKRDRTRARLLVATAEVLAEKGFERLRIADVAAAADISPAAFYAYFTDRGDAAQRVLTRFVDRLYALEGPDQRAPGGPEALRRLITAQLAVAHADGGLLRALGQAIDVTPTLADQVRRRRADWIRQAMATLGYGPAGRIGVDASAPGVIAALEAMMSGALARFTDRPGPEGDVDSLAGAIAQIWCATLGPRAEAGPARIEGGRSASSGPPRRQIAAADLHRA